MATLAVRDADNVVRYLNMDGAGTVEDPFTARQHTEEVMADHFFTAQIHVAAGGTRMQLPAYAAKRGILLKALSTNNNSVFVGDETVTIDTGFELDKTQSVLLRVDELSKIWVVTVAPNEGVSLFGN